MSWLTNQLVNNREHCRLMAGRAAHAGRRQQFTGRTLPGRGETHARMEQPACDRAFRPASSRGRRRPPAQPGRNTRQAILRAAAAEFAARGFAGAGVDRIARLARVNKAMIYYHFRSKQQLYREIVHDMFTAVRARTEAVAASTLRPGEKIEHFVGAIVEEATARPHLPPMIMREAAEGGRRLDASLLEILLGVLRNLQRILHEGVRAGSFRRVDPVLMHFTVIGPIAMYLASASVRRAIAQLGGAALAPVGPRALRRHLTPTGEIEALRRHIQAAARRTLELPRRQPPEPQPDRHLQDHRLRAAPRSGDEA